MAGKKAGVKGKGKAQASLGGNTVPEVYQQMLAEALPTQSNIPERPLKRRRTGPRNVRSVAAGPAKLSDSDNEDDEEEAEFEDILEAQNQDEEVGKFGDLSQAQQTAYRDSDEESDQTDPEWEHVDFDTLPQHNEPSGDLELTLKPRITPQRQAVAPRRKAVSKAEKVLRLETHKMHVLCLLAHLDRRNEWCNDDEAKRYLKPLLDKKMLTFLKPRSDLSQFGRAESLKRGLDQVSVMWRTKFSITARGTRRGLWADDEKDVQNVRYLVITQDVLPMLTRFQYRLPEDAETSFEKSDFRAAARTLRGSRDLGAQLFCALLRSAGVETRLVCSLQPLSFNAGGPPMPQSTTLAIKQVTTENSDEGETVDIQGPDSPFGSTSKPSAPGAPLNPRRRLGHPNAAAYLMPEIPTPPRIPPKPKRKAIHESPYPVFWVEVFDEAHQKWFPVDPLVTESIAKPRAFEPPSNDRENNMSYVIAFEEEGCARDVTKRYTKAYNAKTRKTRVESTPGGERWWRRSMRNYARGWMGDADQIEDTELAAAEAREPMPKNIADFKDHPTYALERHLRRNEVLVRMQAIGRVAAGRDLGTLGGKKMENVYRRRDVKIARSADAWYRLGRDVKMGEQPVKIIAPKARISDEEIGDEEDERAGTNLYTEEQTELYVSPPIVNGRVPKNSFGNLDLFVPSMVPKGGIHIPGQSTISILNIF
jgi:xeroderma pigmentosum group C-complementing protein